LFALEERPPVVVHMCDDIACKARGADRECADLESQFGPEGTNVNGATWHRSPCLGLCEQAPAALFVGAGPVPVERPMPMVYANRIIDVFEQKSVSGSLLEMSLPQSHDPAQASTLRLLRRIGKVDPLSLDDYRANGGYAALRRALEVGPAWVLREITDGKLVGRGGAAFPTGRKWEAVSRAPVRPKYLVCNADESEPGTFKDRVIMERDPFALVEAMTIAGFTVGAERGFIYVRGEYPLAIARLGNAIEKARTRGLLGDDILGRGVRFDIEIVRGAGAYICGEETALFNSMEGFRGEPRSKPPFPVESGLFGKPTCINNVETLVCALEIVANGATAWTSVGTPSAPGTKLFCLSGAVQQPGLYEVPFGTRLDELLKLAGGVREGHALQAVLLGGAAGAFVTPDELQVPLTFEDVRRVGSTLGSGVVLVLDDRIRIEDVLARLATFFRDESCGQCVPCRVGTVRQEELIERLRRKTPLGSPEMERELLRELGQAMRDASICGLGQTATSAVESAVTKLRLLSERA
jgi:NADH-quinone oxidoreductase subunit F